MKTVDGLGMPYFQRKKMNSSNLFGEFGRMQYCKLSIFCSWFWIC
jgi:hypothetical protein